MAHGGSRSGAGRKPGSKSARTKEREAQLETVAKAAEKILGEGAFEGDAHALLILTYKDANLALDVRLDAAKAAIPYEKPKLQSIDQNVSGALGTYQAVPIPVAEREPIPPVDAPGRPADGGNPKALG